MFICSSNENLTRAFNEVSEFTKKQYQLQT